jgi:RNA polymerase sigma factor (TIGR02999 family)
MPRSLDQLFESAYAALRQIAGRHLERPVSNGAISATEVVHECYLKLLSASYLDGFEQRQFLALAARALRQVLVDHARQSQRLRHGDAWRRITLHSNLPAGQQDVDVLELHEALERLEKLNERQARIVEMRYFSGLSIDETAAVLEVSARTVDGDWQMARACLKSELAR